MKTDELITMLAAGESAVSPAAVRARYASALGWAAFSATLLMAVFLGVRPDIVEAAGQPMFWVKLAFPAALLAVALLAAQRLSRPGSNLARVPAAGVAVIVAMWSIAAVALLTSTPAERGDLLFGETWAECPVYITLLSVPALAAVYWAMKGFAPTRLALAGAAAGAVAGTLGALVYALHCDEIGAPFIATWYLVGMLVPAALGAVMGPRLLRW